MDGSSIDGSSTNRLPTDWSHSHDGSPTDSFLTNGSPMERFSTDGVSTDRSLMDGSPMDGSSSNRSPTDRPPIDGSSADKS